MNHGEVLKRLIKDTEMRQQDFAVQMGFSRVYLQAIFKHDKLKTDIIDRACKILNVNKDIFERMGPAIENEPKAEYLIKSDPEKEALKKEVEYLKQLLASQKEIIEMLRGGTPKMKFNKSIGAEGINEGEKLQGKQED